MGVYATLAIRANETPLADRAALRASVRSAVEAGIPPRIAAPVLRAEQRERRLEQAVNRETLRQLRTAGLAGLGGLLVLSLAIGYGVAGRVLSPVSRITARARELGARSPDMTGRIALGGPHDELRELADTVDGLLDRTEGAVASQRRFLADAAHELRTPVAAAKATLDVVLDDPGAGVDDHRQAAGVVGRQLGRMGRLISDLLVLERGSGGRREIIDLGGAVDAAIADLARLAEDRQIEVTRIVTAPAGVVADPDDLRRILANVIENAIVHNRRGGRVEIGLERSGSWSAVRIADDGPGIPAAERDLVFERFRRLRNDTTGTGLGLAIVRDLVAAGGGDVVLEGGAERGAAVTIRLPVAQ